MSSVFLSSLSVLRVSAIFSRYIAKTCSAGIPSFQFSQWWSLEWWGRSCTRRSSWPGSACNGVEKLFCFLQKVGQGLGAASSLARGRRSANCYRWWETLLKLMDSGQRGFSGCDVPKCLIPTQVHRRTPTSLHRARAPFVVWHIGRTWMKSWRGSSE